MTDTGTGTVEEAAFKARRMGIRCIVRWNTTKEMERLSSKADMRHIVFMGNN